MSALACRTRNAYHQFRPKASRVLLINLTVLTWFICLPTLSRWHYAVSPMQPSITASFCHPLGRPPHDSGWGSARRWNASTSPSQYCTSNLMSGCASGARHHFSVNLKHSEITVFQKLWSLHSRLDSVSVHREDSKQTQHGP